LPTTKEGLIQSPCPISFFFFVPSPFIPGLKIGEIVAVPSPRFFSLPLKKEWEEWEEDANLFFSSGGGRKRKTFSLFS